MIRTLQQNGTPGVLVNGQTISDTDWNAYAAAIGFNQAAASRVLSITGQYNNSGTRPFFGTTAIESAISPGVTSYLHPVFLNNRLRTYAGFRIPYGYTQYVLTYGVRCYYDGNVTLSGSNIGPVSQEVEIGISVGGSGRRIALFYPSQAASIPPEIQPTGAALRPISGNTYTEGFEIGTLPSDYFAPLYSDRDASLLIGSEKKALVSGSASYFTTADYYDGLVYASLYLYSPCDAEKF